MFEINIVRFEDESYKLDLENDGNLNKESVDNYESQEISVLLPFIKEPVSAMFYYKKMDPPHIEIKSPVDSNQNWAYWQKINLVSINDINESDYKVSSFSLPTPFSFYTGSEDKIVDHIKSWVD